MSEQPPRNENLEPKVSIEIHDDGDMLKIGHPDQEALLKVAARVVRNIDPYAGDEEQLVLRLKNGEEIRSGGAFAVLLLGKKILVDTRNARGSESARELIKKAAHDAIEDPEL